jgi:hypothetical protein
MAAAKPRKGSSIEAIDDDINGAAEFIPGRLCAGEGGR